VTDINVSVGLDFEMKLPKDPLSSISKMIQQTPVIPLTRAMFAKATPI
jgi:hypothetical protein